MAEEIPTIDEVEAERASTQSPAAPGASLLPDESEVQEDTEGIEEAPKPAPKKRGRPPKVVEELEEAPAPKRRGRPKKVVEEPPHRGEEMPPPAPKRRGRPPKVVTRDASPNRPVRMQAPELDYREITKHLAMHLADEKFTRRQAKVDSWNQFFE